MFSLKGCEGGRQPFEVEAKLEEGDSAITLTTQSGSSYRKHSNSSSTTLVSVSFLLETGRLIDYAILMSVAFTTWATNTLHAGYLVPWALANGLSARETGAIVAAPSLCGCIIVPLTPFIGALCGHRSILVGGLFAASIGLLLFSFSPIVSEATSIPLFTLLLISNIVLGFADGILGSTFHTLIPMRFPDVYGQVAGHVQCFIGLGVTFGPVFGSVAYEYGGIAAPTGMFAVFMALQAVTSWIRLVRQENKSGGHLDKKGNEEVTATTPDWLVFVMTLVAVFCISVWLGIFRPVVSKHYVDGWQWSSSGVGLVFSIYGMLYMLSSVAVGWLSDAYGPRGPRLLVPIGLCLSGAVLAGIGSTSNHSISASCAIAFSMGVASVCVAGMVVLVQSSPHFSTSGIPQAAYAFTCRIGITCGSMFAIELLESLGIFKFLVTSGAIGIVVALLIASMYSIRPLPAGVNTLI